MRTAPGFGWETVLDRLSRFYGRGDWRVPYLREHAEDPFQVLIGTILSQRTRDANTSVASVRLFARFPDAPSLASAPLEEIERLVRNTGYYRTKARHIRRTAQEILDRFGGSVPDDMAQLLTLPGVGPKTANCVIVFGFGRSAVPVDTHVHRIANRLGVVHTKTPEQTEIALRKVVPEQYWIPLNPLLVQHGQNLCRPRRPLCPQCPILDLCVTGLALRAGRRPPRKEDALVRARKKAARRPPPRPPIRRTARARRAR